MLSLDGKSGLQAGFYNGVTVLHYKKGLLKMANVRKHCIFIVVLVHIFKCSSSI